jgi:type IV secretory pathway VirB10-like protein
MVQLQHRPNWLIGLAHTVAERMLARGHLDAASFFIARLPADYDTSRLHVAAAAAHQRAIVAAELRQRLETRQQQVAMLEQLHRQQLLPQDDAKAQQLQSADGQMSDDNKVRKESEQHAEESMVEEDSDDDQEAIGKPQDVKTAAQRAVAASARQHQTATKSSMRKRPMRTL